MWLAHAFSISGSSVGEACAVRLRGFRLFINKNLAVEVNRHPAYGEEYAFSAVR